MEGAMTIHDEIESLAGDKPAVYVGADAVSNLALDALRRQLGLATGQLIPIVTAPFFGKLVAAGTVGGGILKTKLDKTGNTVSLKAIGGLTLSVDMGVVDDQGVEQVLSRIEMLVDDIEIEIEVGVGAIECAPAGATFLPQIKRDANFDQLVISLNLDRDQVARVEGVVAYGGVQTIVAQLLDEGHSIDLARLFPGVTLHGSLTIEVIDAGGALAIIPADGMYPSPTAACECSDIGDGLGPNEPGTTQPGTGEGKGNGGTIDIGGPTVPAPGSVDLGLRRKRINDTGIYIPRSLADVIVSGPYPAARVDVGSGGFVRWRASAVVDFQKVKLAFDLARGAIVVTLKCRAQIFGKIEIDLGKLGKFRVCDFDAEQRPGANEIVIALIPVAKNGSVYLKPVADSINIGKFDVTVNLGKLIGSPFGSVGAVIGFIFDTILARIIAHNLPIEIRSRLTAYLAKASWKLFDIEYWGEINNFVRELTWPQGAWWDAKPNSILVSGNFEG
jgi:hypothetical protein